MVRLDPPISGGEAADSVMLRAAGEVPEQCRLAWRAGLNWPIGAGLRAPLWSGWRAPRRVVIVGVGSSSLGAEIVATVARAAGAAPIEVWRGGGSPLLDEETLLIASSFSGDASETVEAYDAACASGCMRLVVTGGGALARCAERSGDPLLRYDADGAPRSALGYVTFPVLAVLWRLGVVRLAGGEVEEAIADLDRRSEEWGAMRGVGVNYAEALAGRLDGAIPMVVSGGLLAVAARRWQALINENAKQIVVRGTLPEMLHNQVEAVGHALAPKVHGVILEAPAAPASEREALGALLETWGELGVGYDRVALGGGSVLSTVLQSCYLADWTSLYLAERRGVDASRTDVINRIRSRRHAR